MYPRLPLSYQGLFEFKILSSGLTNAPFQKEMDKISSGLPYVLLYLDDIPIHCKNEAVHKEHLRQALNVLKLNTLLTLYAKRSKCSFLIPLVKSVGHVISAEVAEGVSINPPKIDVILSWPMPMAEVICSLHLP